MKKWITNGLMVVVATAMLVGCAKPAVPPATSPATSPDAATTVPEATPAEAKTYKIGVLLPGPTGYFVATKAGIDKAAADLGATIVYADAKWDAGVQLSQAEDFLSTDIDLLALCAADAASAQAIVTAANEANIPVLAFINSIGTDPTGAYDGLVSYVGQNEVNTGKITAQIAKSLVGTEDAKKALLIEGAPGTSPQINRKAGVTEELTGSNIEIVYSQTSNWEKEQALKIVEDYIQSGKPFDVVICQDDNSATGAGQALEEAGMKDKVSVVGLGGSIDGLQAVKDGQIDGTTFMSATEEGYKSIQTAIAFLNGETVTPTTEIKQVEVTKANVDQFVGEW